MIHCGVAPCRRLGVLRSVLLRPPGPPAGQSWISVCAPDPETVRCRLDAEHSRGRRRWREPIKFVVASIAGYETLLERIRRSVQSSDNRDRKEKNDACR